MRGRLTIGAFVLAAFFATYAAPLQQLLASNSMSCCGSGKGSSCCKRKSGPGWVATNSSCASQCACAFPSTPTAPAVVSASGITVAPAASFAPPASIAPAHAPVLHQTSLYQRPPPPTTV